MNYLLIYAHPNPKSFNSSLKDEVVTHLKSQDKDVSVRDLYQLNFNPALSGNDFAEFLQGKIPADIQKEQESIRRADVLIFVYPVWWFNMPAVLKGYIDRVFSRGFAYDVVDGAIKGLLADKRVYIINTTGGEQEAYVRFGYQDAIKTTVDAGIFLFCGMTVVLHKYFYAVPTVTDAARKQMLSEIKKINF
jgi:NAD(P)H dehydrogenase (quinone)